MLEKKKYPSIVYKYRSWKDQYHKNILLKNQLYFSSPSDFNDPFDCRIPEDYSLLNSNEKIDAFLTKMRIDHINKGSFQEGDIEEMLKKFEFKLRNDVSKIQDEYNSLYFSSIDEYFGIVSLSERWNSILMWSHYADYHKGFCVGFSEEKLTQNFECASGPVFYPSDNTFPRLDPIRDFLNTFPVQSHTKSNEWQYEKEYRLVKLFYPNPPSINDRIQTFSDDNISEVIIGLNASEQTKKEIISLSKEKNVPVYQITKLPFSFEIARQQLA